MSAGPAKGTDLKTWQQRMEQLSRTAPHSGNKESAMLDEIADLRTELARRHAVVSEGQAVAWVYTSKLGNSYVTDKRCAPDPGWSETPLYTRPAAPAPEAPATVELPTMVVTDLARKHGHAVQSMPDGTGHNYYNFTVKEVHAFAKAIADRVAKAAPVAEAPTELSRNKVLDEAAKSVAAPATEQARAEQIVTAKTDEQAYAASMFYHLMPFEWFKELLAECRANAAPDRFFMDHGLWHDRVTGQHMYTQDQYDEESRACIAQGREDAQIAAAQASPAKPDLAGLTPERIHEIADSINWANVEWDYVAQDAFAESLLAASTKEQK